MHYILIAIVFTGFGSPVDQYPISAEFKTETYCVTAGNELKEKFHMKYICVPKGE